MPSILEMEFDLAMSVLSREMDFATRVGVVRPEREIALVKAIAAWRALELSRAAKIEAERVIVEIGR